jgi:putative two-component system response regulator
LLKGFMKRLPDVETVLFTDPTEALSWCFEHEPDLIILDYLMPGMNGIESCNAYQRLSTSNRSPSSS